MRTLINFVLFQLAWFACVLGAAHGAPWLGPLVVALVVAYHLSQVEPARSELILLVCAALVGLIFDSILVATGWLSYPAGQWHPQLAPYWIVAMWVAFATTLNVSLAWLKGRHLLALVFGALGGPLAYLAGERLGAVTLIEPTGVVLLLGIGWAVITPLLLLLASALQRLQPRVRDDMATVAD